MHIQLIAASDEQLRQINVFNLVTIQVPESKKNEEKTCTMEIVASCLVSEGQATLSLLAVRTTTPFILRVSAPLREPSALPY